MSLIPTDPNLIEIFPPPNQNKPNLEAMLQIHPAFIQNQDLTPN
ncbi:1555_t:CDS:2 [Dentiscutata heterogama]|uniref:1555_t:CDS:1 n=1 Tax=Dentiscutata heterogama TaxID=1316150 RepID=A0ACA9JUU2_9GLOM|nr:1555_t:CDS:2 [Dentiscutata heterogama]